MASDFELEAMLEIDDSQVDQVNDQLQVTGQNDGEVTPSQRNQQEGIVAGGVSKGIAAAGVFAAILGQLKSVSGFVSAVFGTISRALVPTIELLAEFLRPIAGFVNDFIADPGKTIERTTGIPADKLFTGNVQQQAEQRGLGFTTELGGAGPLGLALGSALDLQTNLLQDSFGPKPDTSDEQKKMDSAEDIGDVLGDALGGFF